MGKPVSIAPLTGPLDVRSSPDSLPQNALRMRMNWQTIDENKLRRGCGWTKLLDQPTYNNQDFHDQLLTFSGTTREPVTMLYESESTKGIRMLWLATQSRIFRMNQTTGNWKLIGDGFGGGEGVDCAGHRFKAAVIGDFMLFTNGFDAPQYHRLEQPPFDSTLLAPIPDLETIRLTRARLVWAWKDVPFFADVTMDSQDQPNLVVWGNYRDPISFDPSKPDSLAGLKPLGYGERVLNGAPTSANTYLLYTTHSIWEITPVGGAQVFNWREAYNGRKTDFNGILKYENALVDLGGDHLYMGSDRFYLFSPYRSSPEPVEWLHRADAVLYDDIDTAACSVHLGWVHGNEAFFTVKRNSDVGCPGITVRINTKYKVADIIDHGFTAACNFRSQAVPTIRDFILDKRICTPDGLDAAGYGWVNEGLPSSALVPSAAFEPDSIYTDTALVVDGASVEDYTAESADETSLCALLGATRLDDICKFCESPSLLVLASSQDLCLKEYGGFYRERCVNPTAVGTTADLGYTSSVGIYLLDGYTSLLRWPPAFMEAVKMTLERFKLNGIPVTQEVPSLLLLRVGISGQTADPNTDECAIVWHDRESRELKCVGVKNPLQHLDAGSAPAQPIEWRMWDVGRNIFIELRIEGVGGDCFLSGVVADLKSEETRNC